MSGKIGHFYEFGSFRLDAENNGLWLGERLVSIAPKSLELLILLIRRHGNIVSREELLETIWHDTFVEEANINYTVSQLRKTLSENCPGDAPFVQTVPKQGYRFVAEIREVFETDRQAANIANIPAAVSLPAVSKSPVRWHFIAIILVGVLFLTSFAYWWKFNDQKGFSGGSVSERNIRTIAILPLKMLNEGEKNKTLSLGMTDSLISRLGSLNRFAVRPLTSVKEYIESDLDPLKFGEKLKVDAVLEGTLQQTENRLRVNVRLWDVRDGAQLWQDSFDSTEADIFNLQDAISTKVTQSLFSELLERDRELLTKRDTDNPEAFRAYIRGRAIMDSKNPDTFEKAIDEFQKAATLDPTFALAYVGFADAFTRLAFNSSGAQADEFYAKSKASANKALALDPQLAEAYAALGSVKRIYDWDWTGAEKNFKRAIELNPNYAKAHLWYGLLLSSLARHDEALAEIKRALEIDPLSPDMKAGHLTVLEGRREYAEALSIAQENAKFNKESGLGKRALATYSFHLGDYAQVIEVCEQELSRKNSQKFVWLSLLAHAYRKNGQPEKADENLRQLEELSQTDTKALYSLAENYTERGRFDEALAVLQKCFELREERMIWLKVEPRFEDLRNDARFQELLRKMNLAN
ncbi:MAG TPA: winged helix-turn-helix domain-containing protein [Pyrinomonadaceae bacterium]|nr:winged helix-turn-helix domain-containing protein [Pyrinomonadaceae bacterium]